MFVEQFHNSAKVLKNLFTPTLLATRRSRQQRGVQTMDRVHQSIVLLAGLLGKLVLVALSVGAYNRFDSHNESPWFVILHCKGSRAEVLFSGNTFAG